MGGYWTVLALSMLPLIGNYLGAGAAELSKPPRWLIGAALHAAAGVAIALVSIDLLPRSMATTGTWVFLALFSAGAVVSYFLARGAVWISRKVKGGSGGAWMVYTATSADLLSDGLMTGASTAVSTELGLLLALSQVVANLPAGFATVSNFRSQGMRRRVRMLAAASFAMPVVAGVTVGFLALREASETAQAASLAIIVGILLVTTVEDLVPQADKPGTSRPISTASFVAGFSFFAVLAANFG